MPDIPILLIENDRDIVSRVAVALAQVKECSLSVAGSQHDLLALVDEIHPRLIFISDAVVRTVGFPTFSRIRRENQTAHLVVLLPEPDAEMVNHYLKAGVNQCVFTDGDYPSDIRAVVERNVARMEPGNAEETDLLMPPVLEPGEKILHYRIIEEIGKGGMGEVYKAEDLKLGRVVAVKVLPRVFGGDPIARKRLAREARSASALNHPNIVTIHAIEESGNTFFIVMEYVQGSSLRDLIAEGPLDLRFLLEVMTKVAGALSAAHAAHLIHRDIKPENIMVTENGDIKLLDFGLAKFAVEQPHVTNLTQTGAFTGTPSFMSPEQTHGQPLDGRTDIFSLGCVLYQAATGNLPFQGNSIFDIMSAINHAEPPLPSAVRPRLPQEFDVIVTRCLAKDRNERYSSVSDLIEEFRKIITILPVDASGRPMGPGPGMVQKLSFGSRSDAEFWQNKTPVPKPEHQTNRPGSTRETPFSPGIHFSYTRPKGRKRQWLGFLIVLIVLAAGTSYFYFSSTARDGNTVGETYSLAAQPDHGKAADSDVTVLDSTEVDSERANAKQAWESIRDSSNPQTIRDFLLQFPESEHTEQAWDTLQKLEDKGPDQNPSADTFQQQKLDLGEPRATSNEPRVPQLPDRLPHKRPLRPEHQPRSGDTGKAPPPPFFPPDPYKARLVGTTWHMLLNQSDVYYHFTPEGTVYLKADFVQKSGIHGSYIQNGNSITMQLHNGSIWEGRRDGSEIRWKMKASDGTIQTDLYSRMAASPVSW